MAVLYCMGIVPGMIWTSARTCRCHPTITLIPTSVMAAVTTRVIVFSGERFVALLDLIVFLQKGN
jgi:hypothetical protein